MIVSPKNYKYKIQLMETLHKQGKKAGIIYLYLAELDGYMKEFKAKELKEWEDKMEKIKTKGGAKPQKPQPFPFANAIIQTSKPISGNTIPENYNCIRYNINNHTPAKLIKDLYAQGWMTEKQITEKTLHRQDVLKAAKEKGAWRNEMRKKGMLDEKGNLKETSPIPKNKKMKKLFFIILFLLLGICLSAQTPYLITDNIYAGVITDTTKITERNVKTLFKDTISNLCYYKAGTSKPYIKVTCWNNGINGSDGKSAFIDIGNVNTTTGAPSAPAQVTVIDVDPSMNNATLDFNFIIPKGDKGDPGTAATKFKYYSPEQFYTGNWCIAIQTCIDSACINGYPIYSSGIYNCGTTVFNFPKFFNELTWYANRTQITCGGFTRPRPMTLQESQSQQNTKYNIFDLKISGNGTGIGFEPAASSNSIFSNFQVTGFATAAYFRTTQNGNIWCWSINNCTNGILIDCEGNNGLDKTKTQSNDTKCWFTRMHVSDNFNMNICFGVYGSFGCDIMYPETEGKAKVFRVLDVDTYLNNTVKGINFINPHFEFTQGFLTGGAMMRVRSSSGIFKIIGANHDVGPLANMILVDGYSSQGLTTIVIEDMSKWEHTGPVFKNDNCKWDLVRCWGIIPVSPGNNPPAEENIKNQLFTGTPVIYAGTEKVWGWNYFNFTLY